MKEKKRGEIYLHIPFCVRKCAYCDFLSFPAETQIRDKYFRALLEEIRCSAEDMEISSIFLGGGTPSLPDAMWIAALLDGIRQRFTLLPDAEISMEANPGTLTEEKLEIYRRSGINRLSIGCQSTFDCELKELGRIHSYEEFLHSFQQARQAGFENINVDLMSGLPGQTRTSWRQSLERIAALEPTHISAYSLILEEGTPMWEMQDSLPFPEEEEERQMYEDTAELLADRGYRQYEISNYAKPGFACRHNLGYWTGTEYLGFGLGASSLWKQARYQNTSDLKEYLAYYGGTGSSEEKDAGHSTGGRFGAGTLNGKAFEGFRVNPVRQMTERLSPDDQMAEFMILGLRLTRGVSRQEFRRRFGLDMEQRFGSVLEKYRQLGLLAEKEDRIFFTRQGISLSNQVLADLL